MENLLVLLDKIQQISPLPVFAQDTVIVQNAGMQHWLNMSLAEQRGISMNMRYALPSQYLWNLIRNLASDEDVPEQSPYSREVLAWRIDTLLASNEVLNDTTYQVASDYWRANHADVSRSEKQSETCHENHSEAEQLKRYQLACQLADLYEQYLIFRPEWIHAWHQGEFIAYDQAEQADGNDSGMQSSAIWQGKLWHLLVNEQPYDPHELVALAISNLNNIDLTDKTNLRSKLLPQRLSFFGINAMAPLWLEFINALSEKIDVHFFHLNPCYAYWGDVVTEKRAIEAWIKGQDFTVDADEDENLTAMENLADINRQVGNPLLANLGQQGREFMALLYQYSTVNIDVFESAVEDIKAKKSDSAQPFETSFEEKTNGNILARVQQDILSLSDARHIEVKVEKEVEEKGDEKSPLIDDSIIITSAHSALREVQGLHDWLLHQFNDDKSLTPKDVLVMCPQVEQYAPYVNAVFTRGWQDIADEVPPLPCSIADRVSKDAEPLVAAFAELLKLPDSRFQVSSLIALLRLPAMQNRFGLNLEAIEKITHWLEAASVHWGLDKAHKQQVLAQSRTAGDDKTHSANANTANVSSVSDSFTWQQGLTRLMRGFAFGDHSVIYQDQMLLPNIEGSDSELLGKLMLIIEQLQLSAISMSTARSATQWQQFLFDLLQQLFEDENDNGLSIVRTATESLVEYCQHAGYDSDISLPVIRDYLNAHFSQPDPGRQFMVGQVTFCSMLPMRSIPFKIIAVLGLNDGEFPRQRQPLSFDLMSTTPAQLGDRSRRGDDRYLFLEAIISARRALYLSFQGRNIKNNKERQPSLVLKELMEYLARGYGWRLLGLNEGLNESTDEESGEALAEHIRQLPMQAFSEQNYLGRYASFDANWLNLKRTSSAQETDATLNLPENNELTDSVIVGSAAVESAMMDNASASDVIRFYQHPARYYGQRSLYLYLEQHNTLINDIEPFVPDRLDSYLLRQDLLNYYLSPTQSKQSCEDILLTAKLSGNLPDLPTTEDLIQGWQKDSEDFSHFILNEVAANEVASVESSAEIAIEPIDCSVTVDLSASNTQVFDTNLYSDAELETLKTVLPKSVTVNTKLLIIAGKLVFYRSSSAKAKDLFTLYLHQLILQVAQTDESQTHADVLGTVVSSHGYYFDTKTQKPSEFYFSDIVDAKLQLQRLIATFYLGQHQPLLLNGDIVEKIRKSKVFEQAQFEQFWSDSNTFQAFGEDAYMQYFWPTCPHYDEISRKLLSLYQPMLDALQVVKSSVKKGAK